MDGHGQNYIRLPLAMDYQILTHDKTFFQTILICSKLELRLLANIIIGAVMLPCCKPITLQNLKSFNGIATPRT